MNAKNVPVIHFPLYAGTPSPSPVMIHVVLSPGPIVPSPPEVASK